MNECCICYEKKSIINFSCNHKVCLFCIVKMKKTKCPYCRKNLDNDIPDKIKNIINSNNNELDYQMPISDYYYVWNGVNTRNITYDYYNENIWPSNELEEEIFPTTILNQNMRRWSYTE